MVHTLRCEYLVNLRISVWWLQWARAISRHKLLETSDPIYEWRQRLFTTYEATLRGTEGYEV